MDPQTIIQIGGMLLTIGSTVGTIIATTKRLEKGQERLGERHDKAMEQISALDRRALKLEIVTGIEPHTYNRRKRNGNP